MLQLEKKPGRPKKLPDDKPTLEAAIRDWAEVTDDEPGWSRQRHRDLLDAVYTAIVITCATGCILMFIAMIYLMVRL